MKKALLFALALIAVAPVAVEAQSPMEIAFMNEIYESRTCRDDQRNDRRVCEYNLNDELAFETQVYESDRSTNIDIYRANMHTRERSPFRATMTGGYWLSLADGSDGSPNCFRLWKWFNEGSQYDGRGLSVFLSVSTNRLFSGFEGSECEAAEREFRNGG
jgi:hypothetical protein